ncbi:MAG: tetratricopeptide repeat protein [Flavobacteriales bacterium]
MALRTIPMVLLMVMNGTTVTAQYLAENAIPNGTEQLYQAGERAYRAGDHHAAILLFSQVLEAEPDHLNAHLQRGFCHSLLSNYELAVADFTAVIDQKTDHTWAYTSRGSAYAKLGRYDQAVSDFDRVIALDPKNEEAYNNRGWARKSTGDMVGACKDWNTSKKMGNAEAKIILTNNRCK